MMPRSGYRARRRRLWPTGNTQRNNDRPGRLHQQSLRQRHLSAPPLSRVCPYKAAPT